MYTLEYLGTEEHGKLRLSLHTSQVAHHAGAYPGFCNISPWMGCSSITGLPPALKLICRYPFIDLVGERHCESKVPCSRT